jgi:hypothetical protein
MDELKTKKNEGNVINFLNSVENEKRKQDAFTILEMMKKITGEEAKMWGSGIIGFGDLHYKYKTGREGNWFRIGFSPRKQNTVLYFMNYFNGFEEILSRLGKFKTGKSCLYVSKLEDIHLDILKEMIKESYQSSLNMGTLSPHK